MSSDLMKIGLEKTLGIQTLDDLVRAKTSEKKTLLIDCSGSMGSRMRNGKRRIEGLREVVSEIQKTHRDVMMIAFGIERAEKEVQIVTHVPDPQGGTPLHHAIDRAKSENVGHAIVISDGHPDSAFQAMESARSFGGRIDVVYVGDPGGAGEAFLRSLAEATGGTSWTGDLSEPKKLGKGVVALLEDGRRDVRLAEAAGEDDDEE